MLDLDGSGEISFKEFLLGMRKIVLDEELEEEELLENIRHASSAENLSEAPHLPPAPSGHSINNLRASMNMRGDAGEALKLALSHGEEGNAVEAQ